MTADDVENPFIAPYRGLFDLSGKRALVIGAGGIGREVALALAAHGAAITAADIDRVSALITGGACEGEWATVDVTDPSSVAALADQQAPDVLVTTVGMNVRKRLADYSDEEFDQVIGVNLRGVFTLIREFGPRMAANGGGSFVAFSSIRGQVVEPGQGAYAASKAGLVQLLRTAAAEYGAAGVRFNAIAPGVVETDLTAQIRADPAWADAYALEVGARPLGAGGRDGRRRRVPRLRRLVLRHGLRAVGRWWLDRSRRTLRPVRAPFVTALRREVARSCWW